MANYYISASGASGNAGTLLSPKDTLANFAAAPVITLADGDVINYIGTNEWPLLANEYSITKSVTIRGCDAAGAAAVATIRASSDTTARRWIQAQAGSTITVDNIIFDATATTADTDAYDLIRYNGSTGLITYRGCSFLWANLGASTAATRRAYLQVSNPGTGVDVCRFYRCYYQNTPNPHSLNAVTDCFWEECVFILDNTAASLISRTLAAGTGGATQFTNCTVYVDTGASALPALIVMNHGGTTFAATVHSNLVWMDSTAVATLANLMRDSSGPNPVTGTRGYNVLLGGPNVSASEILNNGWYEKSWDENQNDTPQDDGYATDQVAYGVAAATIFNAPGSTYAWSTVNGLTITLPKDLRPRLYLTSSLSGGVPGALPSAQTDYAVTIATDNSAPAPGDTVTVTITHSNTGTSATSVVATVTLPAGLSVLTSTPSTGSYVGGVWTIGSQASGASATLTLELEVSATSSNGDDVSVSVAHTSGDPITDTDSSNNSATVTMTVFVATSGDPAEVPYLDVAPIYAPVLLAEINASIEATRNRLIAASTRADRERHRWREYTTRRIVVAASTTVTITSSIERVAHMLLESDADIEVSASNSSTSDLYLPAARSLALLGGSFTTLKLRNPSGTASATVLLTVVD